MPYERLLESAINTYANEMGWEHEDDVAQAVETVTLVFESIDVRAMVDALRFYEAEADTREDQLDG